MANSRQSATIFSPSSKRPTKRTRSSITEHSFQGITPSPKGKKCHPCVRYKVSPMSQAAHHPRFVYTYVLRAECARPSQPLPSKIDSSDLMSSSKTIIRMAGIWLFILVVYASVSLALHRSSHALTAFGDLSQCLVPLLANEIGR